MKKFIMTFVFVVTLMFSSLTSTQAADYGFYLEPKAGVSVMQGEYLDSHKTHKTGGYNSNAGIAGGISIGWDFYTQFEVPVRVEGEYMIRSNGRFKYDSKNVRAIAPQTAFANAYWDFHNTTDITPYVGAGLGTAFIGPNTNLAWNVGGGIMYSITDDIKANLGYRYTSMGKFENNHSDGILRSHEVLIGIRYTF